MLQMLEFTDKYDALHAIRVDNINHLELDGATIRISFTAEVLKFDFKDHDSAQTIYDEILDWCDHCNNIDN